MAAGKSLRSRTLPVVNMAESSQMGAGISPVARERARLRAQARNLRSSNPRATRSQLNFVPDTEPQDEASQEASFQDAQEPFQTDLEQEAGLHSVRQLLDKDNWNQTDFDTLLNANKFGSLSTEEMLKSLECQGRSLQNALNELGVDSQVPSANATCHPTSGHRDLPEIPEDCSEECGDKTGDEEESADTDETTDEIADEEDSGDETGEEGDSEEVLFQGDPAPASIPEVETRLEAVSQDTQPPIIDLSIDSEHPSDTMVEVTPQEAAAGANPRAPRQFIPRPHVLALVSYYERHFSAYKESIKPKLPSQLVPAKVWKEVYADYKRNHPDTPFKEESLKEPLRIQLRDLNKPKEQTALPREGQDPAQDEELMERLMSTDSFRAKGVLQERLNVADRVAEGGNKKKRKAPGHTTEPHTPGTPRPAQSNLSGQTSGQKSVGKVTKSQNLKDAKDGISSMLQVMTSMNDEKKQENLRKVVLNEGKVALHDAKRRESEERAVTLVAQRTAIDEAAKLSRISLLKEQKNLGIIDDAQFIEACKVANWSFVTEAIEENLQSGIPEADGNDPQFQLGGMALGNVAGDSPQCRDLVLGHGALVPLLNQLTDNAKLSMLRNATWTLSNFCRGKPQPQFEQSKPALPALQRLIHSTDEEVLTDACWALSYLSDGTNDKIQAVIEAGVCRRLVELLLHPSPSVLIPALRTVGNIVTGDDLQTQFIINNAALPCVLQLLTHTHKKSIKKEACWTISNITAGNKDQIQAVIDANIIPPLVQLLATAEFDIKKEAAWAISNATSGGTHDQIKYLVNQGCIKPLCDLLTCQDARIVTVSLEGLENILKVGEAEKDLGATGGINLYARYIDEAEGLEKIENLQTHDNNEIYEKAVKILENDEEQTLISGDQNQTGFQFGGNQPAVPSGGFNFG